MSSIGDRVQVTQYGPAELARGTVGTVVSVSAHRVGVEIGGTVWLLAPWAVEPHATRRADNIPKRWHAVDAGGNMSADVWLIHGTHVAVHTESGVGLYGVDAWEDGGDPQIWVEGATNRDEHVTVWSSMLATDDPNNGNAVNVLVCNECMRGKYMPNTVRVGHRSVLASVATCTECGHVVAETDIRRAMDAGRLYWTAPVAWAEIYTCMMCPASGTYSEIEAHTMTAHDDDGRAIDPTVRDLDAAVQAIRDDMAQDGATDPRPYINVDGVAMYGVTVADILDAFGQA